MCIKNKKAIAWKSLFSRGKFNHFHGLTNWESELIEVQGIKVWGLTYLKILTISVELMNQLNSMLFWFYGQII